MNSLSPQTIELICFPGAPNLPIFMAQEKGDFADSGVTINMSTTPNSAYQAENLVNGKFHIAGTAFDNVVAYQEGQGAVKLARTPDLFAFMGATQVELALIVAPGIKSYQDLKGKTLALDALATGFAFVLYEILGRSGPGRRGSGVAAAGSAPAPSPGSRSPASQRRSAQVRSLPESRTARTQTRWQARRAPAFCP